MIESAVKNMETLLRDSNRILIAVSGGADSMALLHMILRNRKKINKDFKVLHINHLLHPESNAWANMVQEYCAASDMPCEVEMVDVRAWGNNVEQAARKARYDAFSRQDCDTVLLAHHANDQLETFFLKLFRGSGVKGLRCMAVSSPAWFDRSVKMIRPLLNVSRHDIERYVEEHKVPFVTDPSNLDTRYDRNWIRNKLIPMIQRRNEIADITIMKSISIQAETYELMTDLAKIDLAECRISSNEMDWRKMKKMSLPRLKNLIMYVCTEHNLIDVSTNHIEQFANGLIEADEDSRNELRLRYFRMYKIGKRVIIDDTSTFSGYINRK